MRLLCLLFATNIFTVAGNSVGMPVIPESKPPAYDCNALGNYGCTSYNLLPSGAEDRVNGCRDVDAAGHPIPYMPWVKKMGRSDIYTLRTGNKADITLDATTYTPGVPMKIHLNVNDINMRFTGVLLYAVDSTGKRVGKFTSTSPYYHSPWDILDTPHSCAGSLMHTTGTFKPFFNSFHYTPPEAGTGKITFRCLVKEGVANTGTFYYPNVKGDLSLEEATNTVAAAPQIEVTALGQSCSDYCSASGKGVCDADAMKNLARNFDASIMNTQPCALPALSTCTSPGLSYGTHNYCYNSCPENIETDDLCGASSSLPENGQRFCLCTTSTGAVGGDNKNAIDAGGFFGPGSAATGGLPIGVVVIIGLVGIAVGTVVGFMVVMKYKQRQAFIRAPRAGIRSGIPSSPLPEHQEDNRSNFI